MKILAIDTASEYLSLALAVGHSQVYTCHKIVNQAQTKFIIPEIDLLLHKAQLKLNDLQRIAYNNGPGSFTGLRIGMSVALGLAYSAKLDLVPVAAFALYAQQVKPYFPNLRYALVTLDARLNQIYLAALDLEDFSYIIEPSLLDPAQLDEVIQAYSQLNPQNTVITGPGLTRYREQINTDRVGEFPYHQDEYPRAIHLVSVATTHKVVPLLAADLLYVRNKVALDIYEQAARKNS